MSIDQPLDQAVSRIAADERGRDPATKYLKGAISFAAVIANAVKAVQTGSPDDVIRALYASVKAVSDALGDSNSEYLLSVLIPEVRRLCDGYDELDERHRRYLDTDWLTLLADADHKARVTRGKEKVRRIAAILSDSARKPDQPTEDSEEMMRVAMNLSDRDVAALKEISLHDRKGMFGRIETRGVRGFEMKDWYSINWYALGFTEHEVESTCGKLYSFGLVAPLSSSDNRPPGNTFSVPLNAYELLQKGRDFLAWTSSEAAKQPSDEDTTDRKGESA